MVKIRVVSENSEIKELSAGEKIVHCSFRPSCAEVIEIMDLCPKLEAIQLPKSYLNTIAGSVILLLKSRRIELFEGNVQGHRKDKDPHYTVPEKVIQKIKDMKEAGRPIPEIENEINRMYILTPETTSYVVRTVTP